MYGPKVHGYREEVREEPTASVSLEITVDCRRDEYCQCRSDDNQCVCDLAPVPRVLPVLLDHDLLPEKGVRHEGSLEVLLDFLLQVLGSNKYERKRQHDL